MTKFFRLITLTLIVIVNNANAQFEYGSYFGKMNREEFMDAARDSEGNYYFVGNYFLINGNNPDLPTSSVSFQKNFGGSNDDNYLISFDSKLKLRWATYLGGKGSEYGKRISCKVVKKSLYVVFETSDTGYAFNTNKKRKPQKKDLCFMKYSLSGKLYQSHYWGGSYHEYFTDWDVDNDNNFILVGKTNSRDSISTNPSYCYNYPGQSAGAPYYDSSEFMFLIRFDTNFNKQYGTYFGGFQKNGYAPKVSFDSKNNYYIAFMNGGYKVLGTSVNKTSSSGGWEIEIGLFTNKNVLEWSTLLGGEKDESATQIVVDKTNDNLMVFGMTNSKYHLIDSMKFSKINELKSSFKNYYLAQFDNSGKRLFCRYLGGNGNDQDPVLYSQPHCPIGFINTGKLGVLINTSSKDYSMTGSNSYSKTGNGGGDGIFYIINNTGTIDWSTYLGGNSMDEYNGFFKDSGSFIVWGSTQSSTAIASVMPLANQTKIGGDKDGFIQKFTMPITADFTIKSATRQCIDNNLFFIKDNSTSFDTNYTVIDSISDGSVYNKKSYSHSFKKPGIYLIQHFVYYKNNRFYTPNIIKQVEVLANPTITSLSVTNDTVFQGEQFKLSIQSKDSIGSVNWTLDTNFIGIGNPLYYKTDSLGRRKIECVVVSPSGCSSRFYSSILVLKKLSVSNLNLTTANTVRAFPNPTSNILNIEAEKYEIFDINGRPMLKGQSQTQIDVSSLRSGMYLLKTEVGQYTFLKQ
jgi:hypothetical protein